MGFADKLMGVFEPESTREKEDRAKEPIYHDRFSEEYRSTDAYREITFNGRNFNLPEVKLCAAILLSGNQNGSEIRDNNHYSLYFKGRYGLMNISTLHRWLYEQGYFRAANPKEALGLYKVPELKMILESLGLKKTGKKSILIERAISSIDESDKERIVNKCNHVFVTEKGYAYLKENGDYAEWHRKSYGVTFQEFNKHRISQGRRRRFHDTIFQALNEKILTYQYKQWYSKLEMLHFWLAESLYDEGRLDLAMQHYIYRLYFSTNLASHVALFDVNLVKINGIKKEKEWIKAVNDAFNRCVLDRIVELKRYYSEQILEIIYSLPSLPYCIFGKQDMSNAIHDLYKGAFDEEYYTDYICEKYEKYIRKYL